MVPRKVISADSHMTEPADLWVERLDRKYRDAAPRVVRSEEKRGPVWMFVAPGVSPTPVAGLFSAGKRGEELREFFKHGYEAARPSGWDPVERLKDQEIDGVVAEVLYSSLGLKLFGVNDPELQLACLKVYNEWLAEFCAHDPKRLLGVGLYSLEALPDVSEIERCAKLGLKGILILATDAYGIPYSDARFEPMWQACADLNLPVSLHKPLVSGMKVTPAMPTAADLQIHIVHIVEQCMTRLVYGGIFERYPKLKVISAENDVGWVANWAYRLDHVHSMMAMRDKLPMAPSDYVRRNIFATFQDDPLGPGTWQYFGADNFMWASDFPHTDSTFPNSLKVIEENFAGVPQEVTEKMVFTNANRLYEMGLE